MLDLERSAEAPEFIDNRNGNTLAEALARLLGGSMAGGLSESGTRPSEVAIAAAFFSPKGLADLAPHLDGLTRVRLLFGVEAPRDVELRRPNLGETPEHFESRMLREGVREAEAAARAARDRFPFTREGVSALHRLIRRLRGQNIEVRRYERAFMHAKAYIFVPPADSIDGKAGVIAGSSNLTGGGLSRNLELNLGRYDSPIVEQAKSWFEELWDEAEPVDLAQLFEDIFAPYTPWEIFLRILFQLYGNEVVELEKEDRGLPLTSFQTHGVARALRLLKKCGGALVADEVGLGKTFIAGEIIRVYRERRQRTLLICPAQLRDTTWKKFLHRFEFDRGVECVSYEQLANDIQLRDPQRPAASQVHLQSPLDDYQLIVVDEAHNYRNPNTPTRAAALRTLLFGKPRDVLLLTATPVNNSLWDLFYLIRFFARQDAFLAERGVLSVYERFQQAMREDPSNLSPELLYPIIDATCVKRTRQFVKKHYSGDRIKGADGRDHPIVFPQPKAITVRYNLDEPLPQLFDEIERALDPDGGPDALQFARYTVETFLVGEHDSDAEAQAAATIGLIRSGLLKRFESSAFAFVNTLDTLIHGHKVFLEALGRGHIVTTRFLREIAPQDETTLDELLKGSPDTLPARDYDTKRLRKAVEADLAKLMDLRAKAAKISPQRDPKLKVLVRELERIATQAKEEATDAIDEAQKRKVLLFSFFADTVEYVRKFLGEEVKRNPALAPYRGRVIAVTGDDDLEEISRQQAIYGFAPTSTEAPAGYDADRFDILVTTDVLAEGVNLQQCRNIVNLDVPWNPMRLVQRHGRIDRIGSLHPRVFLRTIFPAERLDQLLNLEQRILAKIAMAAASIGVASPVDGAAHGQQVFTETREEIERLLKEDPTLYERGGTASAAQTGEEYRQTLRKALAENRDRIVGMPWKAGSGMSKGKDRGVLFCAAVGDRTFLRFIPADEAWRLRGDDTAIISELGSCLRMIDCEPQTPRMVDSELEEDRIFDLWGAAQFHIWQSWMIETDPANLQPKLRPLNRKAAEFIRANPPAEVESLRITQALDVLESPWPRREEIMLREWFNDETRTGTEKAAYLIDRVLETGIEPFREPPTLAPIRMDEIELVCWMALTPSDLDPSAKI
ncbi:helicase-related protein [Bradyrhizobium sp.]|uniref:helicase-related protein n=1 Tax=Bradyrhizobium sp. TaxID=376 RepID=UPI002D40DC1B|nr:helicase-related protein [Bradyrhizobium sp.]HZR77009.1 helicase-related protein [Bradyrhizobium sp.]